MSPRQPCPVTTCFSPSRGLQNPAPGLSAGLPEGCIADTSQMQNSPSPRALCSAAGEPYPPPEQLRRGAHHHRIGSFTSRGSSMPFLVTMICLGCSSTGRERIRAATSSAVFHFASCRGRQS